MKDLFDGAVVAFAEFLVELKLFHVDGKLGPGGKVDALGMENGLVLEVEGAGRIARRDE